MESDNEKLLQARFGIDWITPRRAEIISALDEQGVSVRFLDDTLDSLRIYIPHDEKARHPDNLVSLVEELFDPESRMPLEFVDSYPQCAKYTLATSVFEKLKPVIEVDLSTASSSLILRIEERGWTALLLRTESVLHDLGRDQRVVIISRLIQALSTPQDGRFAGSIGNVKVEWVLTLAEKHSTIYRAVVDDTVMLFVQAADTSILGTLTLTEEDKASWLARLAASA